MLPCTSDSRQAKQLSLIAYKWAAAWGADTPTAWLALYAPNAIYIDHAFQIRRSGDTILKRHWEIWRRSIPHFVMDIERIDFTDRPNAISIRTVNKGKLENDLPSKKASGKPFVFRGVVDFVVNDEGLIESLEEWYTWDFGEGKDVKDYHSLLD